MALSLQDFNKPAPTQELRMNAFQPRTQPSPAANPATINTIATYGAALAPDGNLDGAYQSISNQLKYSASSDTLNTILQQWDDDDIAGSMETLKGVLVDPNVSDQVKQDTLYKFQTNQNKPSIPARIAQSSAIAASEGENGEQENLRVRIAQGFNDVDQYNGWVQQNVNALRDEENPAWQANIKGMVESMMPFADAADQAFFESIIPAEGVSGPVNTVQTLLALGEGRERLRSTLANVPVEQRRPIVQSIITAIRAGSGSLASDTTTLKQIQMMEQMLTPGGYDNADRWADNIFSAMDNTILLTPFSKGLRSLGGALRGADGARVAEQTIARGERAVAATEAPTLQLEFKPTGVDYATDVDNVISSIPDEVFNRAPQASSTNIQQLRLAVSDELANPQGFSIDNVIDKLSVTDYMSSEQVRTLRGQLGNIQTKRTNYLNANVPETVPTIIEAQRAHISGNVQPTSVSQIYKHTNPSKARVAHNAVVADESEQAARTLYGTDRDSAIGNDFLPEIGGPDGRVRAKLEFDEATAVPDASILKGAKEGDGAIWASRNEKKELENRIIGEWKNTIGLTNRSSMNTLSDITPSIGKTGRGLRFNQVFGPKEGGFSNALTGVDTVKASLRKYGITDNEISILARQKDGNYGLANPKMDMTNGDFLIQVKHDYAFDPSEIKYEGFEVSKLWGFIRVPDIKAVPDAIVPGGVTQHLVPKAVNIDQRVYAAGVSAADRSAGLGKQLLNYQKKMLDKWKKLPGPQKDMVDQYIRLANDQELTFNSAKILSRGISEDGLAMLADWKTVQDTLYALENADVNRTLRQRGYEIFEHRSTDTKLIVQPQPRAANVYGTRYYDADTGSLKVMTNDELDALYAVGGTTAKLRKAEDFNGEMVEQVIVKNKPDGGFSRRIRDEDVTLNYRQGYYHVRYENPYFVTRYDPKTKTTSTIARADSRKDAEIEARRLSETQDGFEYDWKRDKYTSADDEFDKHLDVAFSSGRSTQRLRGKRLTRVGSDKTIGDAGLESPIDSLTRSISSVATRTSFRNVLEANKRRWVAQFKHLLPAGPPKFPKDISEIKDAPGANEARHAYRYVSGLQDGYANLIDDAAKHFFLSVSDVAGAKGWGWVDKLAMKASKISPSSGARLTAFRLFLASNPIGQFPLQAFPSLVIVSSLNPLGWGNVIKQAGILGAWHRGVDVTTTMKVGKFTGMDVQDMKNLVEDYELSGMSAAVNAHSYLSDDLGQLANRNILQKGMAVLGKPLKITQSIGFDFGEQTLMSLTWLSERDLLVKRLKRSKLTAEEREELTARVRAITGDMNKGGEMPYNSNTFSVLMQFLQSPHKIASGLILGHRGIDAKTRAKLIAGYTLAFGVPSVPIINQFVDKIMPTDNPEGREIIKGGLTNLALNRFLSSLSGEQTAVDFAGRLQPFSTKPMIEFIGGLMTGTVPEMISGSAAPSLLGEGRIGAFVKAALAPFTPGEYEGVDEYRQIGLTFMQMFTGLSNTLKAQYMMELGKITTRTGQVVDDDVTFMEAMMKAAGFSTIDEVRYWEANKAQWEASDKIDEDIKKLVDDLFVMYTRQGEDVSGLDQKIRVMAEASRVFQNNPVMMDKVADYYDFKANQDPDALFRTLFRNSGLYSPEDAMKIINNSNMSQEQTDLLMEIYKTTGDSYGD